MSNKKEKKISAADLASANWRKDDSLSFVSGGLLTPEGQNNAHETRIVATVDGKIWIQPANGGSNIDLTQTALSKDQIEDIDGIPEILVTLEKHFALINARSIVRVNNVRADVNFTLDPQQQINENKELAQKDSNEALNAAKAAQTSATAARSSATTASTAARTAQTAASLAQTTANGRSTVRVNNARADVNFTSDPQTQINNRLTASQVTPSKIGNQAQGNVQFAGGLIIQWGTNTSQNITFPLRFQSRCLGVFFGGYRDGTNITAYVSDQTPENILNSGFSWRRHPNTITSRTRRWFAIGF